MKDLTEDRAKSKKLYFSLAQKKSVVNFAWYFSNTLVIFESDYETEKITVLTSFLPLGKTRSYLILINMHASNMSKRFPWRIHIQDL